MSDVIHTAMADVRKNCRVSGWLFAASTVLMIGSSLGQLGLRLPSGPVETLLPSLGFLASSLLMVMAPRRMFLAARAK